MDNILPYLNTPFAWGLSVGLFLFLLSLWSHFKTKREFSRFRKLLTDKLELEAKQYSTLRSENESLIQEKENLKHKITLLNEKPENQISKELEIFARAEKQMTLNAPGFAPAWESAKQQVSQTIELEDQGQKKPAKLFRKFFKNKPQPQPESSVPETTAPKIEYIEDTQFVRTVKDES